MKITLPQNHPTKKDSNPSNKETHSLSKLRNRQRQLVPNLVSCLLDLLPDAQQDIRAALSEAEALQAIHLLQIDEGKGKRRQFTFDSES